MSSPHKTFKKDSERVAFDLKHRATIAYNMNKYYTAVDLGKMQYLNYELARRQASLKKHKSIANLENMLKDFEQHFSNRGGKVIWVQDAEEACREIGNILKKNRVKLLVKSKSMITEEIELNSYLEKEGIRSVETDLGEYIVQISGDKPYHIVTPVMHKSAEDIGKIFHEKFDLDPKSTPEQITKFVRKKLRIDFEKAQAGITGANFLIANGGYVGLTENEGNGIMSSSLPPLHIVVAGIEKVVENIEDMHLFWPLLASNGTGQKVTAYNSLIGGPKQINENNGPSQMYVILLDNGRTNLMNHIPQRRALSCIRCGACLNVCPIYKNVGGHTYGSVYSGPIGAVISPHFKGVHEYKHLSYASTLCGRCTEVCPVNIDLHAQLLYNRQYAVENGMVMRTERWAMKIWKKLMMKPAWIDLPPTRLKNYFIKKTMHKTWGYKRELPQIASKSFKQLWKEDKVDSAHKLK